MLSLIGRFKIPVSLVCTTLEQTLQVTSNSILEKKLGSSFRLSAILRKASAESLLTQ